MNLDALNELLGIGTLTYEVDERSVVDAESIEGG